MRWLLVLLLVASCSGGEYRPARGAYNDGVAALAAEDWERAAEALLRARSEAGVDPELRARAAFNLGLAYAGQAEKARAAEKPDLEQVLAHYGTAAGWFQDALRLRPDDAEARTNLAIVRARQQAVADELLADEKALEKRLARLIDAQREVRDRARALLEQARAGEASNPVALEDAARALATTERTLLADAGVIVDLAGSEADSITGKPEDQLTDEDRVRQVQLGQLELWMQLARSAMTDTRRTLDEGKLEGAHGRAEEGVESLKRALEQLMDPVAVLRAIAVDELQLAQQTAYLEEAGKLGAEQARVPAWLTGEHLGGRQIDARSRLDELTTRLDAAAKAPAPSEPAQARMLERVKVALPELRAASDAMGRAKDHLTVSTWKAAAEAELEALLAMGRAIEQFVDLRQAIDLAWAEQGEIVAALDSDDAARAKSVGESVDKNVGRMALIAGLLADEKEAAAAQQQPTDVFDQAEPLRAAAETAIRALAAGKRPKANAEAAHDQLTELRRLFFSVVEHLQELLQAQGETRDDTSEAAGLDDLGRAPLLPGLTTRQGEHRAMGQAIADALAAQADQATDQPEEAQRLGAAAEEVRAALGDMDAASGELERAKAPDQQVSVDLTPALDAQQGALDHLEAALRILQPPPPEEQQEQDQQQQQQDQQQQDQQQQQQDQSVEKRRERVREQEAQRRREREERQRIEQDPVEKDW